MFMERYSMSYSKLLEEIEKHPEWYGAALVTIATLRKMDSEDMEKARGDQKMGEEIHGTEKEVDEWYSARSVKAQASRAKIDAVLRSKGAI